MNGGVRQMTISRIVRFEDDEEQDEDGDNKVCRKGIKMMIRRKM